MAAFAPSYALSSSKPRTFSRTRRRRQSSTALSQTHLRKSEIKTDVPPTITVSQELVIIDTGKDKIIVPQNVYEAKKQVEKSERFKSAVGKVFEGAEADATVDGISIVGTDTPTRELPPLVPREKFALFRPIQQLDEFSREVIEPATLVISRAILQRGSRKWEFHWRGIRISAPVLDDRFYDRFFAHDIKIAPGDALEVALRILQEKDPDTGIYVNARYEVIEVYSHVPRHKQENL